VIGINDGNGALKPRCQLRVWSLLDAVKLRVLTTLYLYSVLDGHCLNGCRLCDKLSLLLRLGCGVSFGYGAL